MNSIKFRVAAKTDVGLVRTNNEDNFQVASDLSSDYMHWVNNEICSLGEKGALLVVADGMGGMNAGEVASALAIETIRERFQAARLTPEVMKTRYTIEKFMNEAIVAADARIKQEAKAHPESRGMGTTIVVGWVLGSRLYVSWCGDSRAYIYNPATGLHQITKDHSYVQTLVDKGVITREDAFDYPESNIITRSLSDGSPTAKPESLFKPYDLCNGDIVLLCTDGLSGMLRDAEMEPILRQNEHDMSVCADELIRGACEAAGADNITLCLFQVLQGGGTPRAEVFIETEARLDGPAHPGTPVPGPSPSPVRKYVLAAVGGLLFLLAAGAAGYYFFLRTETEKTKKTEQIDAPQSYTPATNTPPPASSGQSAPDHPAAPAGEGVNIKGTFGGMNVPREESAGEPDKSGDIGGNAAVSGNNAAQQGAKPKTGGDNPPKNGDKPNTKGSGSQTTEGSGGAAGAAEGEAGNGNPLERKPESEKKEEKSKGRNEGGEGNGGQDSGGSGFATTQA